MALCVWRRTHALACQHGASRIITWSAGDFHDDQRITDVKVREPGRHPASQEGGRTCSGRKGARAVRRACCDGGGCGVCCGRLEQRVEVQPRRLGGGGGLRRARGRLAAPLAHVGQSRTHTHACMQHCLPRPAGLWLLLVLMSVWWWGCRLERRGASVVDCEGWQLVSGSDQDQLNEIHKVDRQALRPSHRRWSDGGSSEVE